jgi:hypothetical protein
MRTPRRLVVAALLAIALTACPGGAGKTDTRAPALGSRPSGLFKAQPTTEVGAVVSGRLGTLPPPPPV